GSQTGLSRKDSHRSRSHHRHQTTLRTHTGVGHLGARGWRAVRRIRPASNFANRKLSICAPSPAQSLPSVSAKSDPGALRCASNKTRRFRVMGLILLIILIILLLGAVPAWPYSRNWGYGPSGGLGLLVLIVIILLLLRVF